MKAKANREKLINAMKAKGLNMNRVGVALGVDPVCVLQWRDGRNCPQLVNALRLSALLDVDLRDIFEVHP